MNSTVRIKKMQGYLLPIGFKNLFIFFAVTVGLNLLSTLFILTNYSGDGGNFDVVLAGLVFMGFVGVTGFSEDFKLFIQNCFTRKEIFISQITFFAINSASMAAGCLAVIILSDKLRFALRISSIFSQIYGENLNLITEFLMIFIFGLAIAMVTYLVTILFNRYDKRIVGICFVVAGIALVAILRAVFVVLTQETLNSILEGIAFSFGYTDSGVFPYYGIITLSIICAIMVFISNRLLVKFELK